MFGASRARRAATRVVAVTASLATAISISGCSEFTSGFKQGFESAKETAAGSQSASPAAECAHSDFPLLKLKSNSPNEPSLAVPQPPGWEVDGSDKPDPIRALLVNSQLTDAAAKFAPTAVVALEDLTGTSKTAREALDGEVRGIQPQIQSNTPGTICGHPSITVTHVDTGEPQTVVTSLIVAAERDGRVYAATLTIQSTQPDNSTYVADKKAMLDGFRFELPGEK